MAVIDSLTDLTVEVCVNGQALKEHPDDEATSNGPNATSVYLESVEGAQFSFVCQYGPRFPFRSYDIETKAILDGKRCSSAHCRSKIYERNGWGQTTCGSLRCLDDGKPAIRPYTFRPVSIGISFLLQAVLSEN